MHNRHSYVWSGGVSGCCTSPAQLHVQPISRLPCLRRALSLSYMCALSRACTIQDAGAVHSTIEVASTTEDDECTVCMEDGSTPGMRLQHIDQCESPLLRCDLFYAPMGAHRYVCTRHRITLLLSPADGNASACCASCSAFLQHHCRCVAFPVAIFLTGVRKCSGVLGDRVSHLTRGAL